MHFFKENNSVTITPLRSCLQVMASALSPTPLSPQLLFVSKSRASVGQERACDLHPPGR